MKKQTNNTKWNMPLSIDIYEALGTLADRRARLVGDQAKIFSPTMDRHYVVRYDQKNNAIMSNDEVSFQYNRLGYPAVAMMIMKGDVEVPEVIVNIMKGIKWEVLKNQFNGDIANIEETIWRIVTERGGDLNNFKEEISYIEAQIKIVSPGMLGNKMKPPIQ